MLSRRGAGGKELSAGGQVGKGPSNTADARRGWTCVARNIRGHQFVADGLIRQNAASRALAQCERHSHECRLVDCWR